MKTKQSLESLIKSLKVDYVNSNITEENFPLTPLRSTDFKVFHFDNRYISSEDAIKEIEKEGYLPATLSELLEYAKEWNNKDSVIALGSVGEVRGRRYVPCLDEGGSGRRLYLHWWGGGWSSRFRFLAVRNLSSDSSTSEKFLGDLDTLDLEKAIEVVKKAGYQVVKII